VATPPGSPANKGKAPAVRRRGGWRLGITLIAMVIAVAGVAASAAGIASRVLPRRFTEQQQRQIMAWETTGRWRTTPAGKIFPATVAYKLPASALASGSELPLTASRVGISPQASCAAGSDAVAARTLSAGHCVAILRATYADETDSMLVTVGVAVMPNAAAAKAAAGRLADGHGPSPGVRPASFGDTLASAFGDSQRQLSWAVSAGPYVIMSTAGYTDGRPQVAITSDPYADEEMTSLANGVTDAVQDPLGAPPAVPRCPGDPGC
jgi:hypothetical protein